MAARQPPKDPSEKYRDAVYLDLLDRLAVNLRRLRVRRKLTQEAVAERSGDMDARVVQLVENRKTNPTFATLARLARGLDVDPLELIRRPRQRGRSKEP